MDGLKDSFWRSKPLEEFSVEEWEALCDGCGKCCLLKLEDDTGEIYATDIGCKLLDPDSCRCSHYDGRKQVVDDCVELTPSNIVGEKNVWYIQGRLNWQTSIHNQTVGQ